MKKLFKLLLFLGVASAVAHIAYFAWTGKDIKDSVCPCLRSFKPAE